MDTVSPKLYNWNEKFVMFIINVLTLKGYICTWAKWSIPGARFFPGFLSIKLLPHEWDTSLSQGYPPASYQATLTTCWYSFKLLGPVGQRADNTIQRINHHLVNSGLKMN